MVKSEFSSDENNSDGIVHNDKFVGFQWNVLIFWSILQMH